MRRLCDDNDNDDDVDKRPSTAGTGNHCLLHIYARVESFYQFHGILESWFVVITTSAALGAPVTNVDNVR